MTEFTKMEIPETSDDVHLSTEIKDFLSALDNYTVIKDLRQVLNNLSSSNKALRVQLDEMSVKLERLENERVDLEAEFANNDDNENNNLRFVAEAEEWVLRKEMDRVVQEKQNELILVTASLESKERKMKDMENEMEKMKQSFRKDDRRHRKLQYCDAESQAIISQLQKEEDELKELLAHQEIKTAQVEEEKSKLRVEILMLRYTIKKMNNPNRENGSENITEELQNKILDLEKIIREKDLLLEEKEKDIVILENLLNDRERKVKELEANVGKHSKSSHNLLAERNSLLIEKRGLEEQLVMKKEEIRTLKENDYQKKIRWANVGKLILNTLGEELDSESGQSEANLEGRTLRKRVKKVEAVTSDDEEDECPGTSTNICKKPEVTNPLRITCIGKDELLDEDVWQLTKAPKNTGRQRKRGRPRNKHSLNFRRTSCL